MSMLSNRHLGLLVIASVLYHALIFSAMHLLEPEFSPIRAPGSAYVLGAYGPLMTTTYFVLSVGLLSVAYGLVTTLGRTHLTSIAFAVVLVAAAGASLAGIFPMDFPPPLRTSSGRWCGRGLDGLQLMRIFVRRQHDDGGRGYAEMAQVAVLRAQTRGTSAGATSLLA